jgi:ribosome modulation factor
MPKLPYVAPKLRELDLHEEIAKQISRELHGPDSGRWTSERPGDAAVQHLKHYIEGYRSRIFGLSDCPYSPGSARGLSWLRGWTIAGIDLPRPNAATG